jgi:GNAT superfamily N-acetyltransferase
MKHRQTLVLALLLIAGTSAATAQGLLGGQVTGNIQLDGQISRRDSVIGSEDVPQKLLSNARADILYTNGDFSAGLRYEGYLGPMLGFRPDYQGQGIANYFVSYKTQNFAITAGHFYEQFGNGMALRAYEDRYLGIDNALRGINVMYRPFRGIILKGVIGQQRYFWESRGLVRGADAEVSLNDLITPWSEAKTRITLGGSFVSKYEDNSEVILSDIPGFKLNLPRNVATTAFRMDLAHGGFGLQAEYAFKGKDPNDLNNYTYHKGEVLWLSASYSQKGFSANIQAKRVDNMGFRSVRTEAYKEMLYINYTPAISKQHTYAFLSMYPYATQSMGEMGLQADVMYKFKKETLLGGAYGTDLHINASLIKALDTTQIGGIGTDGYTSTFFGTGDTYYGDLSVEIAKKLSSKVKIAATYGYVVFNPIIEGHAGDLHHNHVLVGDLTWKMNKKNSLRFEAEWMGSDSKYDAAVDDKRCGDWIMGLVEYNFAGKWFVSVSDQYAYNDGVGNYYNLSVGYTQGATRLQVGYGKQREGIICIGGVCRNVPASNGLTFSLTTSF